MINAWYSICICLNGVSIVILSIVCLRIQKELREIRFLNTMIENEKKVIDRLYNFRYQQHYSEIGLGNEND